MQGFNKYYPPDYDPEKHSSLNSYHGKHALGDRARKIDQGILVVRFELPYNIWCNHCSAHVGQGVRYNAEKQKVGNYYSTPIWSFRFKCHLCSGRIEIRTDPQNTRYVVTEGARQKMEEAEDPERDGMLVVDTSASASTSANPDAPPDPFASLEKTTVQKERALSTSARLSALHEQNATHWDDPFSASQKLRASFRAKKKEIVASEGKARELAGRYALGGEGRLRLEDFRTPARGGREAEEEAREWEAAKKRKAEMEGEERRKRRRSEGSLLGREAVAKTPRLGESDRDAGGRRRSHSSASTTSSSRPTASLPRSRSSSSALANLSRPSPSPSSQHPKAASPAPSAAARSLHSKLALASALKRDPFGSPSSVSSSSSSAGVRGMTSSRSAPAGLAALGGSGGGGGGGKGGLGVGVKVKRSG